MLEQRLSIDGPAGDLECLIQQPEIWRTGDPLAIVCHPHPLHGGTLQNKVVHTLSKTCIELGARSVRFNFRGVGKSHGSFDHGQGEQADLLAVVDYFRTDSPASPLWLGGFSFGACIALAVHAQIAPERLLLVAPAVDMYPQLAALQVITGDWLLIQGGADDVVSPMAVQQWVASQGIKPRLIWLEEAGHFFHGQLNRLNARIKAHWSNSP